MWWTSVFSCVYCLYFLRCGKSWCVPQSYSYRNTYRKLYFTIVLLCEVQNGISLPCGMFMMPSVNPPAISPGRSFFGLYFGSHCVIGSNPCTLSRKDHLSHFSEHLSRSHSLSLLSILNDNVQCHYRELDVINFDKDWQISEAVIYLSRSTAPCSFGVLIYNFPVWKWNIFLFTKQREIICN